MAWRGRIRGPGGSGRRDLAHLLKVTALRVRSQTLAAQGRSRLGLPRLYWGICLAPRAHAMSTALGWYREGGPIMLLIALVGLAGFGVLFERFYVIVLRSRDERPRSSSSASSSSFATARSTTPSRCAPASHAALSDIGLVILRSRSRDEQRAAAGRDRGVARGDAAAVAPASVPRRARRSSRSCSACSARCGICARRCTRPARTPTPLGPSLAGLGRGVQPGDSGHRRRRRAGARARLSRQPSRIHHRAARGVLGSADQRPDRSARCSSWPPMS